MFRVLKYFLIVFVFFLVHCDAFLPLQRGKSRSNKESCADKGSCDQKNNEEDNNDDNDEENNSFFYLLNNTGDTVSVSTDHMYQRKIEHTQCMRFNINDLEDISIGPSRCRWKCPEVCKLCPKDAGYYVMDLFPDSKEEEDLSDYNGFKKVNSIPNPQSCLKFIPKTRSVR